MSGSGPLGRNGTSTAPHWLYRWQSVLHIDKALGKARFWPDHAEQDLNEPQRKTLKKLLDMGDGGSFFWGA